MQGNASEIVFYDWLGDGEIDHASIVVSKGTSWTQDGTGGGHYGQLINQHTKDRKFAIWHLDPHNGDKYTTRIYAYRIK